MRSTMRRRSLHFVLLLVAIVAVTSISASSSSGGDADDRAALFAVTGNERDRTTLVVVENEEMRESHAQLLKFLSDKYEVTEVLANEEDIALEVYEENIYANLIIIAREAEEIQGLDPEQISRFVDSGGNVLVITDDSASEYLRELVGECAGAELDDAGYRVIDHVNAYTGFDEAASGSGAKKGRRKDAEHQVILAHVFDELSTLSPPSSAPVVYRGTAIDVDRSNTLVSVLLRGSEFSYTGSPGKAKRVGTSSGIEFDTHLRSSGDVALAISLQARNGARVVVMASVDAVSDKFMDATLEDGRAVGNRAFAENLIDYSFRQRGVLRIARVHHQLVGKDRAPEDGYRIGDFCEYQIDLVEWDGEQWQPFAANDVQVEFVMLDPYVRQTLKHDNRGRFSTSFQVPDKVGVYQFKVHYSHPGYNPIAVSTQVPVRPFRHDEYERFIPGAYPYYFSALALMAAFFTFSIFFLFSKGGSSKSSAAATAGGDGGKKFE